MKIEDDHLGKIELLTVLQFILFSPIRGDPSSHRASIKFS